MRGLRQKLEAVCRALAPRDLDGRPLYIVFRRELDLPLVRGPFPAAGGCAPWLDRAVQDDLAALGRWRGRGPALLLDPVEIHSMCAAGWAGIRRRFWSKIVGAALHELSHALTQGDDGSLEWSSETKQAARSAVAVVMDGRAGPGRARGWLGHELGFVRVAVHLAARADDAGVGVALHDIFDSAFYGLSDSRAYFRAFAGEAARLRDAPLREILRSPPPLAALDLWRNDVRAWIRSHRDAALSWGAEQWEFSELDSMNTIIEELNKRRDDAMSKYATFVTRAADNERLDVDELDVVLRDARRTPDEFSADVERLRDRRRWAAALAEGRDVQGERQHVAERLAAAEKKLSDAIARLRADFNIYTEPLRHELAALDERERRAIESEERLRATAPRELHEQMRGLDADLNRAANRVSACRYAISEEGEAFEYERNVRKTLLDGQEVDNARSRLARAKRAAAEARREMPAAEATLAEIQKKQSEIIAKMLEP